MEKFEIAYREKSLSRQFFWSFRTIKVLKRKKQVSFLDKSNRLIWVAVDRGLDGRYQLCGQGVLG